MDMEKLYAVLLRQHLNYDEVQTTHTVAEAKYFCVCMFVYPSRFSAVNKVLPLSLLNLKMTALDGKVCSFPCAFSFLAAKWLCYKMLNLKMW